MARVPHLAFMCLNANASDQPRRRALIGPGGPSEPQPPRLDLLIQEDGDRSSTDQRAGEETRTPR